MFGVMMLLLIINTNNLILNFVFVLGLGITVSSVTLASVTAQRSSVIFMMWYINRSRSLIGNGRFLFRAGYFYQDRVVGFIIGFVIK